MRIAFGSFCHETNFFGNVTVDRAKADALAHEGADMLQRCIGTHTYLGGFVDEAAQLGVELVPIRRLSLKPSGPCDPDCIALCRDRMVQLLEEAYRAQPFDGIALCMHGGSSAEGFPDPEGEILAAIREKLGYEIPIGVVLDLHGNVSQKMVKNSTLLMGCKQYPHVDEYDEARILFRLLCQKIREGYPVYQHLVQLPWLMVPAEGVTAGGPAGQVLQACLDREAQDPQLLQLSFFQGFPYADTPDCCVSFVAVAKSAEIAEKHALGAARYAWSIRKNFTTPKYSAQEAVDMALAMGEEPVLINDSADNPGSGAPGDGTFLLRELLERNISAAFGFIYDPEVAQQAVNAGVGATIDCLLGGKSDGLHGEPIALKGAYVKHISDGNFVRQSQMGLGQKNSLGLTACLVVGNVEIAVASFRTQTFDEGPFVVAGIAWQEKRLLALKSAQHFKGWWADKVRGIVACDGPGVGSADLTTFRFQRTNTGYYPLGDPSWEA